MYLDAAESMPCGSVQAHGLRRGVDVLHLKVPSSGRNPGFQVRHLGGTPLSTSRLQRPVVVLIRPSQRLRQPLSRVYDTRKLLMGRINVLSIDGGGIRGIIPAV